MVSSRSYSFKASKHCFLLLTMSPPDTVTNAPVPPTPEVSIQGEQQSPSMSTLTTNTCLDTTAAAAGNEVEEEEFVAAIKETPFEEKEHLLIKPNSRKTSAWWKVFHVFQMAKPENKGKEHSACCNYCGYEQRINQSSSSPTQLSKHMKNDTVLPSSTSKQTSVTISLSRIRPKLPKRK